MFITFDWKLEQAIKSTPLCIVCVWEHELKWNLLTTQLITTCETFGHTTCVVVVVVNLLCIIIKLHSIYFALKRPMHSIFLSKNIFLRFSNSAIRFIHRWCSISLITRHIGAFHWNMTVCIWCVYIICISERNDPIVNWNSYVYSFKPKCLFILLNHSLKMNLVTMTIKSISIKMLLLNTLRMLYPLFRNYDITEILWTSIQFWNMFGKRLSEKAYKYIYQFISEMKWTKCVHTKFREKKKIREKEI